MGHYLEQQAAQAFALLQKHWFIRSYVMAEPNDALDCQHIDAVFTRMNGKEVCLQIKSTNEGVRRHMAKYPHIPCMNLGIYSSIPEMAFAIAERFSLREPSVDDPVQ